MMHYRLSSIEKDQIIKLSCELDKDCTIFLYGSRTDLKAKGGDIDLLILSQKLTFKDKLTLLSKIKESLGDQKIDLTILDKASFLKDQFFQQLHKIELTDDKS